jgi:polysaccharide export outer membrane protein
MMKRLPSVAVVALTVALAPSIMLAAQAGAQKAGGGPSPSPAPVAPVAPPAGVDLPPGYVIGIQDTLDVFVYKEKDMSAEKVVVRPDGKISLPLVNDIHAAGLTVEALRQAITKEAANYIQEPTVSVVIKEIHSRFVSITGNVAKPSQYPLLNRMTVMELISTAGGLLEYAKGKEIRIARNVNGKPVSLRFNFKDFLKGKPEALAENIELQPNDIVTVP